MHQLKDRLIQHLRRARARAGTLTVSLVSFGFKHGIPYDADLVFDVRFLPNPHFVEALRALDGRDARGARTSSCSHAESRELLEPPGGLRRVPPARCTSARARPT